MHQHISQLLFEIGEFQLTEQSKLSEIKVIEKSQNQLVSYVDIESEKRLVKGLLELTPTAGFLGEEGTSTLQNNDLYWIIDPIDGTTNFLFGHSKFCISIALYADAKPVYGAVYVPAEKELFHADSSGAYLNGKPIHVAQRSHLSESLMATGFPYYNFKGLNGYIEVLKTLMQSTQGLRRMGSAAIDLVYTAAGRFDGFFELNLQPWDVAGGAYIVQQAGGVVTDFSGEDDFVFGTSIIAANENIHQLLSEIIAKQEF
jgi:myo-inositol-1(or 4)-monophosphatase